MRTIGLLAILLASPGESSSEGTDISFSSASTIEYIEDKEVEQRHYNALMKEHLKSKPNPAAINKYLNLDFEARRKIIKEIPQERRPEEMLIRYPCFVNHSNEVHQIYVVKVHSTERCSFHFFTAIYGLAYKDCILAYKVTARLGSYFTTSP